MPEAFLIVDELLLTARRIIKGLVINREAIQRNLDSYAPFAATERILMAAARAGADRQKTHERLRALAMAAWQEVQSGRPNPLIARLKADTWITAYLPAEQIESLAGIATYTGIAPQRSRDIARRICALLSS